MQDSKPLIFRPPGAISCGPLPPGQQVLVGDGTPSFRNLGIRPAPAHRGSGPYIEPTIGGTGIRFDGGGTTANALGYATVNHGIVTLEVIFVPQSTTGVHSICSFNDSSDGTSATFDKQIYNDGTTLKSYCYSGGVKILTGPTIAVGRRYHVVVVADGTNQIMYVDGARYTSAACGSTYTGYGSPHFVLGRAMAQPGAMATTNANVIMAGFSSLPWSAGYVAERYRNPWSFMRTNVAALKSTPAVATIVPVLDGYFRRRRAA